MVKAKDNAKKQEKKWLTKCKQQWILLVIATVLIGYLFLFKIIPVFGWVMGFMDYKLGNGPNQGFNSQWVGFDKFIELFNDAEFWASLTNTLSISFLRILFSFTFPIALALMINEIPYARYKKFFQTVSYLPHFVSWVVVGAISTRILSVNGPINAILQSFGMSEPYLFMEEPDFFYMLTGITYVWKEMGWDAIIYISAMSAIDPSLYEAAKIDGAGRMRRIFSITLPSILTTIVTLLVLKVGTVLNTGYEQMYVLQTGPTSPKAEVLDLYIYRVAFRGTFRYSLATCASILKSLISVVMIFTTNKIANKFEQGIML